MKAASNIVQGVVLEANNAAIKIEMKSVEELPDIWTLVMEQKWLVKDLIPEGSVVLLTGESGSGKSSVALSLAHAVVRGTPFLGHEAEQRKVLIVDKENGLQVYHERLARFAIEHNTNMHFWGHWCDPEPAGPTNKLINEFAAIHKPLIIFDSFIAFHPGSEQDATETRVYMEGYRRLAGLGATVVVIHHTGKGEATKEYRGSSDIKASIDVGYVLSQKKPLLELLELKPFKSREGVLEPIRISLEGSEFRVAVDMDYLLVEEVLRLNPNINQSRVSELLPDLSKPRVRRVLALGERKGTFLVIKGAQNALFYSLGTR